jgi:hypothetical protein
MSYGVSYAEVQKRNKYINCVAVVELLVDPAAFNKAPNIFVVPDDSKLFARYLLQIKKPLTADGKDVLQFYTKLRMASIKPRTKKNRILEDLKEIEEYGPQLTTALDSRCPTYRIIIRGLSFLLCLYNYPYCAPILQLEKSADSSEKNTIAGLFYKGVYMYDYEQWSAKDTMHKVVADAANKLTEEGL